MKSAFNNALPVASNYKQIKNDPQKVSKIMPFINKYNWKEINFHHINKNGTVLRKIINQLLLIYYLSFIILDK